MGPLLPVMNPPTLQMDTNHQLQRACNEQCYIPLWHKNTGLYTLVPSICIISEEISVRNMRVRGGAGTTALNPGVGTCENMLSVFLSRKRKKRAKMKEQTRHLAEIFLILMFKFI
jgi:hypothetical protein